MSIRESSLFLLSAPLCLPLCPFLSLTLRFVFSFVALFVLLSCELEHEVPNSVIQMQGIYGRGALGERRRAGREGERERLAIKFNATVLTLDPREQ